MTTPPRFHFAYPVTDLNAGTHVFHDPLEQVGREPNVGLT